MQHVATGDRIGTLRLALALKLFAHRPNLEIHLVGGRHVLRENRGRRQEHNNANFS